MKKTSFIMIALLFAGSAFGQIVTTKQGLTLSQTSSCNFIIENAGPDNIQVSFIGLGSPGSTFPSGILTDTLGNILDTGYWMPNDIIYFNLDFFPVLQPGEKVEMIVLASDTSNLCFREIESFIIEGIEFSIERFLINANTMLIGTCGYPLSNTNVTEEIIIEDFFVIFPNPTYDYINISTEKEITKVVITNQLGEILLVGKNTEKVDVSNFPAGLYFVQVQTKFGNATKKLLKR